MKTKVFLLAVVVVCSFSICRSSCAIEGHINVTVTRGGEAQHLLYTAGSNVLRIERLDTNRPYARDIINLQSGEVTLVFPHNQSFVRLKNTGSSGDQKMQTLPPPAGVTPNGIPAMPIMPTQPMEKIELTKTGETTNLLGYACMRYEIKRRGELVEIWATEQLFPFEPYLESQPPRFGPRMIEEQWGDLLKAKKLFPLRAVVRFEQGPERLRFEVQSVKAEKIEDKDGALFQPPANYHEIQPLPF